MPNESIPSKIVQNDVEKDVDSGFISRPSHLKIQCPEEKLKSAAEERKADDLLKIGYRPIKSRTQLFGIKSATVLQEKVLESSVPSVFQKTRTTQQQSDDLPKLVNLRNPLQSREPENDSGLLQETPFKKNDHQPIFVTPSLRQFSVAKKSLNQMQPSTCEKEKPAKILFTTPIARPPPGSFGMDATPKEVLMKPPPVNLHRKLSPIKEPSAEKEHSTANQKVITIKNIEYLIDKKIGSGGSSSVFLARSMKTGKEFAIKLVDLDGGDQQLVEGYLNETKLLAKLQGNINVVTLFDYCHLIEKNQLFMVMEKGESDLHKILQSYRNHIPLYELMNYWYQMLQAVNYIHHNGVIHSDLKPANFLMINGRLKLIDFGIASNIAIDSTSIIKFTQAGTFNYISPEALIDTSSNDQSSPSGHQPRIRLSTKSDVWSLGCILYLLVYKKTPFSHIKSVHQKIQAITNPRTAVPYHQMSNFYPPMLMEMIQKCLIYNPKERSSVAEILKFPFAMIIPIRDES